MLALFKSHYSIGKSILTLNDASKVKDGGSDSIFQIALDNNLSEIILVEDSLIGFSEAYKRCTENNIKLLDLPIEIIQNIIEYETCKRICQLKSVCKLWKILTPKSIDVKSVILDNKIYHEIYEKYNIYNISQNKCIVGDCCRYEIGYSVVYFPIEELPNYNETDITEEDIQEETQEGTPAHHLATHLHTAFWCLCSPSHILCESHRCNPYDFRVILFTLYAF